MSRMGGARFARTLAVTTTTLHHAPPSPNLPPPFPALVDIVEGAAVLLVNTLEHRVVGVAAAHRKEERETADGGNEGRRWSSLAGVLFARSEKRVPMVEPKIRGRRR